MTIFPKTAQEIANNLDKYTDHALGNWIAQNDIPAILKALNQTTEAQLADSLVLRHRKNIAQETKKEDDESSSYQNNFNFLQHSSFRITHEDPSKQATRAYANFQITHRRTDISYSLASPLLIHHLTNQAPYPDKKKHIKRLDTLYRQATCSTLQTIYNTSQQPLDTSASDVWSMTNTHSENGKDENTLSKLNEERNNEKLPELPENRLYLFARLPAKNPGQPQPTLYETLSNKAAYYQNHHNLALFRQTEVHNAFLDLRFFLYEAKRSAKSKRARKRYEGRLNLLYRTIEKITRGELSMKNGCKALKADPLFRYNWLEKLVNPAYRFILSSLNNTAQQRVTPLTPNKNSQYIARHREAHNLFLPLTQFLDNRVKNTRSYWKKAQYKKINAKVRPLLATQARLIAKGRTIKQACNALKQKAYIKLYPYTFGPHDGKLVAILNKISTQQITNHQPHKEIENLFAKMKHVLGSQAKRAFFSGTRKKYEQRQDIISKMKQSIIRGKKTLPQGCAELMCNKKIRRHPGLFGRKNIALLSLLSKTAIRTRAHTPKKITAPAPSMLTTFANLDKLDDISQLEKSLNDSHIQYEETQQCLALNSAIYQTTGPCENYLSKKLVFSGSTMQLQEKFTMLENRRQTVTDNKSLITMLQQTAGYNRAQKRNPLNQHRRKFFPAGDTTSSTILTECGTQYTQQQAAGA
jgi:hypothetical protein